MIWSKLPVNSNKYACTVSISALNTNPGRLAGHFGSLLCHISPLDNEQKASYLLAWVTGKEENSNPGTGTKNSAQNDCPFRH